MNQASGTSGWLVGIEDLVVITDGMTPKVTRARTSVVTLET